MSRLRTLFALCMFLLTAVRIILPVIDAHSIELDPDHSHVVVGARNAQEAEAALSAHQHSHAPVSNEATSGAQVVSGHDRVNGGVRVMNVASPQDSKTAVFAMQGQDLFIAALLACAYPLDGLWRALPGCAVCVHAQRLLCIDPPPKTSI